MPKVNLRPIDKFEKLINENISHIMGRTIKGFAEKTGMATSTARNRVRHPLDLTLEETFNICQKFHIDIAKFVSEDLIRQTKEGVQKWNQ